MWASWEIAHGLKRLRTADLNKDDSLANICIKWSSVLQKNFIKVFKIGTVIVPRFKVEFTLLDLLLCYSYFNTSFCCGIELVEM